MTVFPHIRKINPEDTKNLPAISFRGNIHIINTPEVAIKACEELATHNIIGFDTETRPAFSKNVNYPLALLQLSSSTDAYLFRIQQCGMPYELTKILTSKRITKVGLAIHDDILQLQKIKKFKAQSFIDLQHVAKELQIEHFGLKKLTEVVMGATISKRQQLSNWNVAQLTDAQIRYAATDAWICLEIFILLAPYLAKK